MFNSRISRLPLLLPFLAVVLATPAAASSIQLDQALFGHLDQALVTTCTSDTGINNACGPTAAVNSFTFLENRYPQIYGNTLIPHINGNTAQQDQIAVADMLSCYMSCGGNTGGTAIADFIQGKMDYINSVAPGTTYFLNMNIFAPGGAYPNFNFLFKELSDQEDVELLVGFYQFNAGNGQLTRMGGHYVTLTGIDSPTDDGNGSISFIDPSGGVNRNNIATFLAPDGSIRTTAYGNRTVTIIEAAVSESPIPEPATVALLTGSLVIGIWVRRRATAAALPQ